MDHVNTFTVFFDQPDKGTSDDDPFDIWGDLPSLLRCGYTKTDYEGQLGYLSYSLHIPFDIDNTCALGIFPAKNWMATGEFTPVEQIGVAALETRNVGREFCSGCPVGWSQLKLARTEPYSGILAEGPEFETLYSFGGQTGVDNIDAIIAADRLSDELGLDTISAGVTIGFAMELYEKGILGSKETGGLELKFGNHEAMVTLLRWMAFRHGIGNLLADGVKAAAETIGKGSEKYALHVKGL